MIVVVVVVDVVNVRHSKHSHSKPSSPQPLPKRTLRPAPWPGLPSGGRSGKPNCGGGGADMRLSIYNNCYSNIVI